MKCPKCGGEIPFYDIRPDCKYCGVNILYYAQDYELERDAKRAELEGASARMRVADIKAVFIGSRFAVFRMIFVLLAVCALMIPFGTAVFKLPFYEEKLSAGLLGVIEAFSDGLAGVLPDYLQSTLFATAAMCAVIMLAGFAAVAAADAAMLVVWLLSFLKPKKSAVTLKRISAAACVISLCAQAAAFVCRFFLIKPEPYASFSLGFGAAACFAAHLILIIINSKMLKKGITPVYREFDPKRKELLKKVRKGEIDLDELTLPVFESEEEYEQRMSEFRNAAREEAQSQ